MSSAPASNARKKPSPGEVHRVVGSFVDAGAAAGGDDHGLCRDREKRPRAIVQRDGSRDGALTEEKTGGAVMVHDAHTQLLRGLPQGEREVEAQRTPGARSDIVDTGEVVLRPVGVALQVIVAAVRDRHRHPVLGEPGDDDGRLPEKDLDELLVVEIAADLHHLSEHLRGALRRDPRDVGDGVRRATALPRLFLAEDDDLRAFLPCLDGCEEAGSSAPDDENVGLDGLVDHRCAFPEKERGRQRPRSAFSTTSAYWNRASIASSEYQVFT